MKCLLQMRKYDLHLNQSKCKNFFQQEIEFLVQTIKENQKVKYYLV